MKKKLFNFKKHKKGFTLIELLAVIVVLSIISLIGYMVVGPVIEESRIGSTESNLSAFERTLKEQCMSLLTTGNKADKGEIYKKSIENFKGNAPINSDNYITYDGNVECEISMTTTVITNNGYYCQKKDNDSWSCSKTPFSAKPCMGTGTNRGDRIDCGSETFYVLESDATTITMLAAYNLNVGPNANLNSAPGLQAAGSDFGVSFGGQCSMTGSGDGNPEIQVYLNRYKEQLVKVFRFNPATTVMMPQPKYFGCRKVQDNHGNYNNYECEIPFWASNTRYTIGSFDTENLACNPVFGDPRIVETNGEISTVPLSESSAGLRPVVKILKSDLEIH